MSQFAANVPRPEIPTPAGSVLDFSAAGHLYATHQVHAFAAKCPPPLAAWAIAEYTSTGGLVVDAMAGSGTTLVEALLAGRPAIGIDIDPLARLIARAKVTLIDPDRLTDAAVALVRRATEAKDSGWRPEGIDVDRWFRADVQADLSRLREAIAGSDVGEDLRPILACLYSSLIVARTSVANVRDIAHSRHHYQARPEDPKVFDRFMDRALRAAKMYADLRRRVPDPAAEIRVEDGDATALTLEAGIAELYFSSPPYCSALDYTRANIFSVAWLGELLGTDTAAYRALGRSYIGTERAALALATANAPLPPALGAHLIDELVVKVGALDRDRAWIVYRYFRAMRSVLAEARRVVQVGGHVVLVVCPSNIRRIGIDTHTLFEHLAGDLGELKLVRREVRTIHDGRRLMPYLTDRFGPRMRTEYVLAWQRTDPAGVGRSPQMSPRGDALPESYRIEDEQPEVRGALSLTSS